MTPADTPPSREQLLYWLHEAAEIEHHLMCCYLYAAFSLKREDARWTAEQRDAVGRWRRTLMSVVFEEMTHLALVGNLAQALGAGPHMGRPALPVDAGPYPAGFVIRLAPFCAATIEHFQFLERPAHEALTDADGFAVLAASLQACVQAQGEAGVFIGDQVLQVDAALAPLPGMTAVTDLASALRAIETIVTQGEGAGSEHADSHFSRFSRVGEELAALTAADPGFEPAWPAATNPVMNPPIHSAAQRVHVSEPRIARWLDIGNALYTTSLRCLIQGFAARDRATKAAWLSSSFALMRALVPVGEGLAARPATTEADGPHAGLSFTPLRTLAALPTEGAAALVAERLGQLRQRALELPVTTVAGEAPGTWEGVIALLGQQEAALRTLAGLSAATDAPAPSAAPIPPTAPTAPAATTAPIPPAGAAPAPAASPVEIARGRDLSIHFEGRRCIHSRHCVLDAPGVFKANTPGEWIHPDALPTEALVAVALSCPSGAIRYERHDGGAEEAAPAVNQLRIRENGPYAVHATLQVAGRPDGYRATLCRCGQSQNKPWCDGSHVAAGFTASGEPKTGAVDPLAMRDGPLAVTPLRNGPLQVEGPLEICAGTGRTVARVTQARLCRCGRSGNKPFCDLSHVAAGFTADGA